MAEITHIGNHPKRHKSPKRLKDEATAFLDAYRALCRKYSIHVAESIELRPMLFFSHDQPEVLRKHLDELMESIE